MSLKICHWVMRNGSGMNNVASSLCEGEKKIGLDSVLADPLGSEEQFVWDADINVSHTHIPPEVLAKSKAPTVWVAHGSPEHVFRTSMEKTSYGQSDSWMLCQNWLRRADACVTFWERNRRIWQSMCQRGRTVDLVTLGVDKKFWKKVPSRGAYAGKPSVLTAENAVWEKTPLDLLLVWGTEIREAIPKAALHCLYIPHNMHRWVFPLVNANGTSYGAYISGTVLGHEELRNAFNSVDYYIGLVRYGEFNRMSLEANASGCKTISYRGNPYSDFWLDEGDQFTYLVPQLTKILKGETEPRKKKKVPDIGVTVKEFSQIYERLGR